MPDVQPPARRKRALCAVLLLLGGLPGAALADESVWAAHNRVLTGSLGGLRQDYREDDPYGRTGGALDTERGAIRSVGAALRWQEKSLLLQAAVRRSAGATAYDGYLQSGGALRPFAGTTGNIMLDLDARAGWSIAADERWQWLPFVEVQRHLWRRDLTQYGETFRHTAVLAGLQLQWRQSGAAAGPWSFEIEAAAGPMTAATLDVPAFAFSQPLGRHSVRQVAAAIAYDIAARWRLYATAATRQFNYGQSASQGVLTEPASRTRQTVFGVGLGWRY